MEHGAPAYYPCTKGEIKQLEYVQRLGSRMVPDFRHLPYNLRCHALNLYTMEYRRIRADMIFLYRLLVCRNYPDLEGLFPLASSDRTRGHPYKLEVQRTDGLPQAYRLSRRALGGGNVRGFRWLGQ